MLVEKRISSKINYEVLRDLETSQSVTEEPVNPLPPIQLDPPPMASTPRQRRMSGTGQFLVPEVPAAKKGPIKRFVDTAWYPWLQYSQSYHMFCA